MHTTKENNQIEFIEVKIPVPYGYIAGRWYGDQNIRPILAIHGWQDNLGTWDTLIPLLPKHLSYLCIDLPGHGRSSKLPNGIVYHSMAFLLAIRYVWLAYKWDKVSLMGHSLGATHGYMFTAMYPEKIDMFIMIDIIRTRRLNIDEAIYRFRWNTEKYLIEDERLARGSAAAPPTYTEDELLQIMYNGNGQSVDLDKCHHILERNVSRSSQYPDKYFFSRDGRIKYYIEMSVNDALAAEMAKRMCKVPICVIKGSNSNFINESGTEIAEIFKTNNPEFQFHEVEGSHHVHLNNPEGVAAAITPFILKHRPPTSEHFITPKSEAKTSTLISKL